MLDTTRLATLASKGSAIRRPKLEKISSVPSCQTKRTNEGGKEVRRDQNPNEAKKGRIKTERNRCTFRKVKTLLALNWLLHQAGMGNAFADRESFEVTFWFDCTCIVLVRKVERVIQAKKSRSKKSALLVFLKSLK